MNSFVGQFFFNTRYSLYQVDVSDITVRIMKMTAHSTTGPGNRPLINPVGGTLNKGHFMGISIRKVVKYGANGDQRPPMLGTEGLRLGSQTSNPIAFFLNRDTCDDCFGKLSDPDVQVFPFDEQWSNQTIVTLREIGMNHPLITISNFGVWAVPEYILRHI